MIPKFDLPICVFFELEKWEENFTKRPKVLAADWPDVHIRLLVTDEQ